MVTDNKRDEFSGVRSNMNTKIMIHFIVISARSKIFNMKPIIKYRDFICLAKHTKIRCMLVLCTTYNENQSSIMHSILEFI